MTNDELLAELEAARREIERLREAICTHRSQKSDDRCIEDDDRLYAALGDGIKCDRRVGDKAAMLHNCERFIDRRCEGGGWPTYADLEAENARLNERIRLAAALTDTGSPEYAAEFNGDLITGSFRGVPSWRVIERIREVLQ